MEVLPSLHQDSGSRDAVGALHSPGIAMPELSTPGLWAHAPVGHSLFLKHPSKSVALVPPAVQKEDSVGPTGCHLQPNSLFAHEDVKSLSACFPSAWSALPASPLTHLPGDPETPPRPPWCHFRPSQRGDTGGESPWTAVLGLF